MVARTASEIVWSAGIKKLLSLCTLYWWDCTLTAVFSTCRSLISRRTWSCSGVCTGEQESSKASHTFLLLLLKAFFSFLFFFFLFFFLFHWDGDILLNQYSWRNAISLIVLIALLLILLSSFHVYQNMSHKIWHFYFACEFHSAISFIKWQRTISFLFLSSLTFHGNRETEFRSKNTNYTQL